MTENPSIDLAVRGGTRTLMIRAAADLLQKRGYHGTGVAEILAQSGAPRGSLYHHFPGGKRQITVEAIAYAAQLFARDLDSAARDAVDIDMCCVSLSVLCKRDLLATQYEAGCPLAAVALDAPSHEDEIMDACRSGFALWADRVATHFERLGLGHARANHLANQFVRSLLGSAMAARVTRSTVPIDEGIAQLREALLSS